MCKKEVVERKYTVPPDWRSVKIEIAQYNYKEFLFCPECQEKTGMYKENGEPYPIASIEDRLFEVIQEIVSGVVNDR